VRELLAPLPESISTAPGWWVALSGGADSVALLYALVAYRGEAPEPPIRAIHVNHGLHADAPQWAKACEQHCQALSVPLQVSDCQVDPAGRGLEANARSERYRIFEAALGRDEVLFTAHHADDLVETILLRLFRGAGPKGLAGIPRQRPCAAGVIYRPLLDVSAASLRQALDAAGVEYVIDPSNLESDQDRNYVRHKLLPLVAERWPGYRETIQRAATLQAMAHQRLSALPLRRTHTELGEPALLIDAALDPQTLAAQLHQWLSETTVTMPDRSRLLELARQALTADRDRQPELVWADRCLRVWNGLIVDITSLASVAPFPKVVTVGEQQQGEWGRLDWEASHHSVGLVGGEVMTTITTDELTVMTLPNRPEKPVKKWLQEMRIPPWWRRHLPVLMNKSGPAWLLPVGPLGGGCAPDEVSSVQRFRPIWTPPARF
jgi:tRNA(Ile)-lysidine synthase